MHESDKENNLAEEQMEILLSIMIQLSRIYDLLVAGLRNVNHDEVINILNDHEKGVYRGPVPSLSSFGKDFVEDETD